MGIITEKISAKFIKPKEVNPSNMLNNSSRLTFLDQARGLIMLFMAMDHALYFWSGGRYSNEGLPLLINGAVNFNLPTGSWMGFIVMLLSSLSAPGFLFISGYVLNLSIKRRLAKGATEWEIDKHLAQRGLSLLALQVFVASVAFNVPFFIQNNFHNVFTIGTFLSLSVLSTIGFGFILLILGRRIDHRMLVAISTVLFGGSQVFLPQITRAFPHLNGLTQSVINIFILPIPFSTTQFVNNNFPVISWFFPLTLGWFYGKTYDEQRGIRYEAKRFAVSGLISLSAFFLLRLAHFGDYLSPQGNWQTLFVMSKYPPSFDYFLFYLGILFLVFSLFIKLPETTGFLKILEKFGKVPLFFYNIHLWLYALVPAILVHFNFLSAQAGMGIWLLGLIILYPMCRKYGEWRLNQRLRRQTT